MGCISAIGGFTGLRLPETLHHRLPQTLEEGEEFGKDWTFDDCFKCIPTTTSPTASYENLSKQTSEVALELRTTMENGDQDGFLDERTPLELDRRRRQTMKKLVRQQSVMDTQKTSGGAMQLTYWF
jgi:hypothetical protein